MTQSRSGPSRKRRITHSKATRAFHPRSLTALPTIGLLLVAAVGCSDAGSPENRETHVVQDSAGVTVVKNFGPAWDEGWRVDPEPSLSIGEQAGDEQVLLSRVVGAVRLDDGTVVVANGQTNELRWYDPDGMFVRSAGGSGEGPGEFEYLRALARCSPDTLHAFDLNWQARQFTLDGEYLTSRRITEPGTERSPYQMSCARDGLLVVTGWGMDGVRPQGFYAAEAPAWTLNPDGSVWAELGSFVTSERIGSPGGSGPHPFGRAAAVAAGSGHAVVARGQRPGFERYDADGRLTLRVRGPDRDLTLTPAMVDAYADSIRSAANPAFRQQLQRELAEMHIPDSIPAVDRVLVDRQDHVWTRHFRPPARDAPAVWDVYDPTGQFLGTVETPDALDILEIGSDYLLGIHRDEFDVERVRVHALHRDPA